MPQTLAPVDPNVPLPPSVARAAAAAEALHKATYGGETPTPPAPDATPPAPPAAPTPAPVEAPPPSPTPAPTPPAPVADPPAPPAPEPVSPQPPAPTLTVEQALDRARSFEGRFKQSQRTIEAMQQQMQELGDELIRSQHARDNPPQPQPGITQQDIETFGPELVDAMQRIAQQTVRPDLDALRDENRRVQQRVTRTTSISLSDALTRAVPNWRAINVSEGFQNWVRLPDVYSGQVREKLLKHAWQAGDASRVIAFFEGFLREVAPPPPALEPSVPPPPAPQPQRQPALSLPGLVAPGRPHPAPGDHRPAAETQVITHAQIRSFYDNVRRGAYVGREADKQRDEAAIFAAQREGRVKG